MLIIYCFYASQVKFFFLYLSDLYLSFHMEKGIAQVPDGLCVNYQLLYNIKSRTAACKEIQKIIITE